MLRRLHKICSPWLSRVNLHSLGLNVPSRTIIDGAHWPSLGFFKSQQLREDQCPVQADVVIIGGGLVGMSVAFWLRWTTKMSVVVVERDPTYMRSASMLGLGSIRQQFSEPEHIQMSLFSFDFLRNAKYYLSALDDTDVNIEFNPQGCLLLANQQQAETMKKNYDLQIELGAKVDLFDKTALQARWPWLNVADVELGCYGYENEGWFDPGLLLKAMMHKCSSMGVNFVAGEVVDFETSSTNLTTILHDYPARAPVVAPTLTSVVVALPNSVKKRIRFAYVVNAAGPWAADAARLAGIGSSEKLTVPLPVEPRLQRLYIVRPKRPAPVRQSASPPPEPGLDTPFLVDPNRLCIERRGLSGEFILYSSNEETDLTEFTDDPVALDVDYSIFNEKLRAELGHRIPSLASSEITCAWTGICDYNTVDQNWIIGFHPYHLNMCLCNGSSGHGSQHAIAVGRAITELILYGHYKTIDLTRFSFDRFYLNRTVSESNAF